MEFSTVYGVIDTCISAINGLGAALEKLPDSEEFDSVKEELREQKKKIKETLEPIKREYDVLQELRKRGATANFYK